MSNLSLGLPAYQVADGSDFKALSELKLTSIRSDWFGQAAWATSSFCVASSTNELYFRVVVEKSAVKHPDAIPGSFREELWKFDCAELFLSESSSTKYQEINLAPQAAWWSASFESYRGRSRAQADLDIKLYSKIQTNSWEAGFVLNKAKLSVVPTQANVTFVLARPSLENSAMLEHQYLSFSKLSAAQPDFHLASEFPAFDWQI